ncbi:3-deoxy-manno-octulosonate-8-phosphatase KdsC [Glaciimonas immobilis]|uniref:3-deoxy-D-manno-octulosonate 8-phosphate phosphatase KdsC n=1 Tax=Glaciimonas immobilis TaxID=728004 RepID=A0A840RSW9_9BURK|nr:3-deoxy-manno-octulosonate-8-phosphatase KdsC [Glaciimonas immobilis]KAF3998723.1 3-deoxy-manno-octulosonate-8-phosphatase KdsC [Glaciimonas immobilis]MBB5201607.1 3-deoxy-D-manno-octulosonate 8-phosphate phosphatase (KDO 8-P phosphatase) [Glaciimonas immobilis]
MALTNTITATISVSSEVTTRAARVRLMIFDVDGVLTDGGMLFGADGEALKRFNVHDGLGIKLLQQAGIATAIISARTSAIVSRRASDLGITHVYQGAHNKNLAFAELLTHTSLRAEDCGFIGDDIIDLPILSRAGLAVSVPNGHPEVKSRVHYVTQASGGHGAAREVCDLILRAQGKYEAALAQYLTGVPSL